MNTCYEIFDKTIDLEILAKNKRSRPLTGILRPTDTEIDPNIWYVALNTECVKFSSTSNM